MTGKTSSAKTKRESIYTVVSRIPSGRVVTYGQIAASIGSPRSARHVGNALRLLGLGERKIPWWRVVNRNGELSINQNQADAEKEVQKANLEAEGVDFVSLYKLDLGRYQIEL